MGVLYEYFRTSDALAVARLMEDTDGGPLVVWGEQPVVDAIDAKRIDPTVVLGQLVSIAGGVPWSPDLVGEEWIWPAIVAEDGEYEGPWVIAIADVTRDVLADIADEQRADIAERWSGIEELVSPIRKSRSDMLPMLTELVELARRARAEDESLFCWMCL